MKLNKRTQVNSHNLCLGCGLCSLCDGISMIDKNGKYLPSSIVEDQTIEDSCPAKGYNLKQLGKSIFGNIKYKYELGYYRRLTLAHSNNADILKQASSGGVITQIAAFLLTSGQVDGVISNKFIYSGDSVRTKTFIASTIEDLRQGQGSKYCPTTTLSILSELDRAKKYLLIGTPCQIAGMRMYTNYHPEYKLIIPYTITNFCGGYRDFKELDYFVKKIAHIKEVCFFRHRGEGQPGSMLIKGKNDECFKYPYPDYAKLSYEVKNERCTLCMDATGELADFSCGDAWLKKIDKESPWSIIIARSIAAETILKQMQENGELTFREDLTEQDIIDSQKSNITSKKYRQYNRLKLRNILLKYSPSWCDSFPIREGSIIQELHILLGKTKSKIFNSLKK